MVSSSIVFGIYCGSPAVSASLPSHKAHMTALHLAQKEVTTISAELGLQQALIRRLQKSTKFDVLPDDLLILYRKNAKQNWTGPSKVTGIDQKWY